MTESSDFTQQTFRVMGGPASLTLRHSKARRSDAKSVCNEVRKQLDRLEARYSRFNEQSLVSEINRSAGSGKAVEIDEEMRGLLQFCDQLHTQSEGLFDPTAGTLNSVWNLQDGRLDNPNKLPELLTSVGWKHVRIGKTGVHLENPDTRLDLGGIVKEYAVDMSVKTLRLAGFHDHIVELAGDVFASGTRSDVQPWRIGISDPSNPGEAIKSLELKDTALATSGSYQRFFTHKGKRYSHFLNPKTGEPVEGAVSASVLAETTLMAGAIATIACLKGKNGAPEWLEKAGLPWLIVDEAGVLQGPLAG